MPYDAFSNFYFVSFITALFLAYEPPDPHSIPKLITNPLESVLITANGFPSLKLATNYDLTFGFNELLDLLLSDPIVI